MDISILTLFPGMFAGALDQSILGRAQERSLVQPSPSTTSATTRRTGTTSSTTRRSAAGRGW